MDAAERTITTQPAHRDRTEFVIRVGGRCEGRRPWLPTVNPENNRITVGKHDDIGAADGLSGDRLWRGKGGTTVAAPRCEYSRPRFVRGGEPRHDHLVANRIDAGTVHGAGGEFPSVAGDRHRRGPSVGGPTHDENVAFFVWSPIAVHHHRSVGRHGHVGVATLTDPAVETDRNRWTARGGDIISIGWHQRRPKGHRTAPAVAVVTVAVIGLGRHLASVEPRKKDAIGSRECGDESMLDRAFVIMEPPLVAPSRTLIGRAGEHHAVGIGATINFLEAMGQQGTIRSAADCRSVGPVGEETAAVVNRAGVRPGQASLAIIIDPRSKSTKSNGIRSLIIGFDPSRQHAVAIRS